MNENEHRKQMLVQQIADHRKQMRRELESLRDTNPVLATIRNGRQLLENLREDGPRRDAGAGQLLSHLSPELVIKVLPVALQVLRAVLRRRREKRAGEQHS